MKDTVVIYYKDKEEESQKIQSVIELAETKIDIHVTEATTMMRNVGFEFPVISLSTRLYGYNDGMDVLKEIYVSS